jgi:hypothetical protein
MKITQSAHACMTHKANQYSLHIKIVMNCRLVALLHFAMNQVTWILPSVEGV